MTKSQAFLVLILHFFNKELPQMGMIYAIVVFLYLIYQPLLYVVSPYPVYFSILVNRSSTISSRLIL